MRSVIRSRGGGGGGGGGGGWKGDVAGCIVWFRRVACGISS